MTHLLQASIPKNVALRYYRTNELPAVEADATQLRQIVMNLVVNAAEAIGAEAGIISITTGLQRADQAYLAEVYAAPDLPEGWYVALEVADTGQGMDATTRARIFDPFFTTKFTGRGLGLAAVLGIVRGHKGALNVYSEPGHGSTFKILLPISAEASAAV
jgi:signal transduction histidine kinase